MTRFQMLKAKREEILRIAARHGASNVRVFGSVARGDCHPDSDVDFLVTLDADCSLLDHAALLADLEHLLGCRVDVAPDDSLRPALKETLLKEAIPL